MKKLLLVLLALPMLGFGQNVTIPDAIFKAYLVGNTNINTNGDNQIQVSEAAAFTGTIDCSYDNISNLTGIEAFTALTILYCYNNQLSSLDVRNGNNTNFYDFRAGYNPNLYCIDVDNDVYSTANWLQHDPWASFSNDCSATNITNTIWTKFNKL